MAKGITTVDGLSLLTLRGPGMVGVPGIAERLFRTLAAKKVNIILISQASSEHTICFAVRSGDAARGIEAIEQEFRHEVDDQLMMADHRPDQAILAVVGEGMKGRPGIAGKLFDSLGRNNININAIAQGASERNISCVIDAAQQVRALNAIHQAFFESRKRLALAVVGVGNIGSALHRAAPAAAALSALARVRRAGRRARQQPAVRRVAVGRRPRELEDGARRRPGPHEPRRRWRIAWPRSS